MRANFSSWNNGLQCQSWLRQMTMIIVAVVVMFSICTRPGQSYQIYTPPPYNDLEAPCDNRGELHWVDFPDPPSEDGWASKIMVFSCKKRCPCKYAEVKEVPAQLDGGNKDDQLKSLEMNPSSVKEEIPFWEQEKQVRCLMLLLIMVVMLVFFLPSCLSRQNRLSLHRDDLLRKNICCLSCARLRKKNEKIIAQIMVTDLSLWKRGLRSRCWPRRMLMMILVAAILLVIYPQPIYSYQADYQRQYDPVWRSSIRYVSFFDCKCSEVNQIHPRQNGENEDGPLKSMKMAASSTEKKLPFWELEQLQVRSLMLMLLIIVAMLVFCFRLNRLEFQKDDQLLYCLRCARLRKEREEKRSQEKRDYIACIKLFILNLYSRHLKHLN